MNLKSQRSLSFQLAVYHTPDMIIIRYGFLEVVQVILNKIQTYCNFA